MVEKYFKGIIPAPRKQGALDRELIQSATNLHKTLDDLLSKLDLNGALEGIWELINRANKYIEDSKPWQLFKSDRERLRSVIYNLMEVLRIISLSLSPFMPDTCKNIWRQIGGKDILYPFYYDEIKEWGRLAPNAKISKGKPLFPRIEKKDD